MTRQGLLSNILCDHVRSARSMAQALREVHTYLAEGGALCRAGRRPKGAPPSPHAALLHPVQMNHPSDPWLQVTGYKPHLQVASGESPLLEHTLQDLDL